MAKYELFDHILTLSVMELALYTKNTDVAITDIKIKNPYDLMMLKIGMLYKNTFNKEVYITGNIFKYLYLRLAKKTQLPYRCTHLENVKIFRCKQDEFFWRPTHAVYETVNIIPTIYTEYYERKNYEN